MTSLSSPATASRGVHSVAALWGPRASSGTMQQKAKTTGSFMSEGAGRECMLAAAGRAPFDYVPPPQGMLMATVPYKWPSDEEWSRAYIWDYR